MANWQVRAVTKGYELAEVQESSSNFVESLLNNTRKNSLYFDRFPH